MARAKQAIPVGFHTITPHLTFENASAAIDWYKAALAPRTWAAPSVPMAK